MIGRKLGSYEITAKLGEGGMGEVWRARDTKLERDVAIKVLPAAFVEDHERLARFEREAKLLAQLHHPNIASIFGMEESESTKALVMELVEGPTLADRLESGSLPLEESLSIARQIAEALEEAHEKGIIHRDLKPQNIKASVEGKVKVLDFGLAKAMDPAGVASGPGSASQLAASPTLTLGATQMGVILGTAAYMAPEQAKGLAADKRADIWAFGVVLFEMLTGKRLFEAPSVPETLAQVLTRSADLDELPAATPAAVRRLLRRCLERSPKNRLHDIADARIVIDDLLAGRMEAEVAAVVPASADPVRSARLPWAIAAAAVLAFVAVLAIRGLGVSNAPADRRPLHFQLQPSKGERLPSPSVFQQRTFALAPDGSKVAYLAETKGTTELRMLTLATGKTIPIPGSELAAGPFFSPDGKWLGFISGTKLEKVALSGGAPTEVTDVAESRGAVWGDDGNIYLVPDMYVPIVRVPANGGTPEPVTRIRSDEGELQHRWPEILPGSKVLLYAVLFGGDWDTASIVAERLDTGERRTLIKGGSSPRYLPTGHLVYVRAGSLYALAFDPRSLTVSGSPVEVAANVYRSTLGNAAMDVSSTGLLLTAPADESGGASVLSWIDRDGRSERLPVLAGDYNVVSLSPKGDRAVLGVGNGLAILDLARNSLAPIPLPKRAETPTWSLDGRQIYFGYETSGTGYETSSKAADDSGEPTPLFSSEGSEDPYGLFRDGKRLLTLNSLRSGETELLVRDLGDPKGEPTRLLASRSLRWPVTLSPDDRWVAYPSIESGRMEIYARPTSSAARQWQVSVDGGTFPVWSRKGDEIFFLRSGQFVAVTVHAEGDELVIGQPRVLFEGHRILAFDSSLDGRRILAAEDPDPGARLHLDVVVNWFDEVERKVEEAGAP